MVTSDINYKGSFDSIEAVWAAYPYGGIEGDYLLVNNVKYRWNKYVGKWENAEVVTETPARETITFDGDVNVQNDLTVAGVLRAKKFVVDDLPTGIEEVEITESAVSGGNNVVTITYTNGESQTFIVKNGEAGKTAGAFGFASSTASQSTWNTAKNYLVPTANEGEFNVYSYEADAWSLVDTFEVSIAGTADAVEYDDTTTQLDADNVQEALVALSNKTYPVDSALDNNSTDPVENKVITKELKKASDYLTGDIRLLAVGQYFNYNEVVRTSDGQLRRMSKNITPLSLSEELVLNDIKASGSSTYSVESAVEPYDSTNTYTSGDYAFGRPSVLTVTIDLSQAVLPAVGETASVSVTIGSNTHVIEVTSSSTAASIAASIDSAFDLFGWTMTDNSDGTLTIVCDTAGANDLSVSFVDTDNINIDITKATTSGALTLSKYSGSAWSVAAVATMATDGIITSRDVTWLTENATVQNNIHLDLDERTAYVEAVDISSIDTINLIINASGIWYGNSAYKHKLVPLSGAKYIRLKTGNSYTCNYTFLTSTYCTVNKAAPYSAEATRPYSTLAKNSYIELKVPADAVYLYLRWKDNNGTYYIPSAVIKVEYVKDELEERTTNKWLADNEYTWQTHRMNKIVDSFTYQLASERTSGLALAHCSDMHGDASNLQRVMQYVRQNSLIDDAIHTGDIVYYSRTDAVPITSAGVQDMLQVIGNHDHWGNRETAYTDAQKFARYMSNIGSWGVEYTQDVCYYYKDYYTDTRLIVLDCMQWSGTTWNAAQEAWFIATLESARTAGRRVVVATHCPLSGVTDLKNGFNDRNAINMDEINVYCPANVRLAIKGAVQDFIDAGGTFVCYLTGHTHFNKLGWLTDYPDQLQITMSNSGGYRKDNISNLSALKHRNAINKDEFNIIFVRAQYLSIARFGRCYNYWWQKADTITIDYVNKEMF